MPITLRSKQEVEKLRAAGQLVAEAFVYLRDFVRPGATTLELDALAEEFIRSRGATPVYKGYVPRGGGNGRPSIPPFPGSICTAVNDVICHGIPRRDEQLKAGDIIGVDIGVRLHGWVGDACVTYPVGDIDAASQTLVRLSEECLWAGIEQARAGHALGDIGAAIQEHAEGHGLSVVHEYTGHGVSRQLHDEPTIFHVGERGKGRKLLPGMVFTIEPMINAGKANTKIDRDAWTVRTVDGKRSSQFEHTVVVTADGAPLILTLLQ